MKNIFVFFLSFFLLISCRDNENNEFVDEVEIKPTKVNRRFTDLINNFTPTGSNSYITLDYDNGNLIRKNGGVLYFSGGSGYDGGYFTRDIYTDLVRKSNIIELTNHSSNPGFNPQISKKVFTLDNLNNVITKYNFDTVETLLTYNYYKGKLVEIVTNYPNNYVDPNNPIIFTYSETFQYDINGNMTRSFKVLKVNGVIDNTWDKTEIIFGQFDNAKNPFKSLKLLDEFFYRSLSKNNYQYYKKTVYHPNGSISWNEFTKQFSYDTSGNLILE